MNLRPVKATLGDVRRLRLREEDSKEVSENWRETVMGQVALGAVTAFFSPVGELAGLYGVQLLEGKVLVPWLLCSDVAARYPRDVMRLARAGMAPLRKAVENGFTVGNRIPLESINNRRFVGALGFTLTNDHFFLHADDHQPQGRAGLGAGDVLHG